MYFALIQKSKQWELARSDRIQTRNDLRSTVLKNAPTMLLEPTPPSPSPFPKKGNQVSVPAFCRLNGDMCPHLLISGILVLQLLKDPEMKTSLPPSDQRITVGRACWVGFTESSKSCCQGTNSLSPGSCKKE